MRPSTSVYLDALRWLAAIGVFLFHGGSFVAPWILGVLRDQGFECVAVFFVLSGFVIRFVSLEKEHDWRQYTRARAARLYPVVVIAIIATLVADAIGTRLSPAVYDHQSWFNPSTSIGDILSYLTFTNEIWFRHVIVGSDEPFWSLGFEAAYYLFFALAIFSRGWRRILMLLLWVAIIGPKIVSTLPLWLLGVFTCDLLRSDRLRPTHPRFIGVVMIAVSIAIYSINKYAPWHHEVSAIFVPGSATGLLRSAAYMTVVGVAVAINLVGFDLISRNGFRWPVSLAKAIRWLAGGSFTLYLTHEPLLILARAALPGIADRPALGACVLLGVLIVTLLLAELGERRKRFFRRLIEFRRPVAVNPA